MKEITKMQNYQLDIQNFQQLLEQYFADPTKVKQMSHKAGISILLPREMTSKRINAILAEHNKTHLIPEFDDEMLDNEREYQDFVEITVIDGKLTLGYHVRSRNGDNEYIQRQRPVSKIGKTINLRAWKRINFNSTAAVDSFCVLRNKLRTKEDKDILTALLIYSDSVWIKDMPQGHQNNCIEITQEMIDAGLTKYYHGSVAKKCIELGVEPLFLPMQVGDYIREVQCEDGHSRYLFANKHNIAEYIIE